MRPVGVVDGLVLAASLALLAPCAHSDERLERLEFATHILPLLTKAGCNAGACHGAATGQGGFRLSLLGYDPEQDHRRLTRESGGRRIDFADPAASLFLRKATREIEHEGDRRIRRDSAAYAWLSRWVAAGAPYGSPDLRVTDLAVTPLRILATDTNLIDLVVPLRVTATFSDGSEEDVSSRALYSSNDDAVADVGSTGLLRVSGAGATGVMVRYGGQVGVTLVDRPFPGEPDEAAFGEFQPQHPLDDLVVARLRRLNLAPAPLSGDAEFLRRVRLDLTGRLPEADEVLAFLAEPDSPWKRARWIDRLIASEEFIDLWTFHLADLLLISGKRGGEVGAQRFHGWLREQVSGNVPWDALVRALLTAEGDPRQVAPANYLLLANDPRDLAEQVGSMFLGSQIACARCHAHPSDRWTQLDYHQFAAFFARVSRDGGVVREVGVGEVEYPSTRRPVRPKPLGEDAPPGDGGTKGRRDQLAEWLASANNPRFNRALVNRVWGHLLGRGLVEPVDDLRPSNPASHPDVLDGLAREFAASGGDLRALIRSVVNSRTYQLSSQPRPGQRPDDRFHAQALWKPLPAAVLVDILAQATGIAEEFPDQPKVTRAVQLVGTQTPSRALEVLGRCPRERNCDRAAVGVGGGLAQALHLINGPTINRRLGPAVAALVADADFTPPDAVRLLYLRTVSRPPTGTEVEAWTAELAMAGDRRREVLEDLLWALLNSREFAFNH